MPSEGTQRTLGLDKFDFAAEIASLPPERRAVIKRKVQDVKAQENTDRYRMRMIMENLYEPKNEFELLRTLNDGTDSLKYTESKVACLLAALYKQDFIRIEIDGKWHKRRDL
jgi:hypothetical protein